jgi:hypothetical protein
VASVFQWFEATEAAMTIRDSLPLTAALSAAHLVGFTLVTGGALVSNLRLLGVLFPERPAVEITGPAARGIAVGLAVSVTSGVPLFSTRASSAGANSTFQMKMLLLLSAATFHYTVHRRMARHAAATPAVLRVTGGVGLSLWIGLALAGCAFILLE